MLKVTVAALLLVVLFCILSSSDAAYCHGRPRGDAHNNTLPFYTQAPKFVKSVPFGKLYTLGEGENMVDVVHVYGSPYEMGYAAGTLLKDKLTTFIDTLWKYLEAQATGGMWTWIPEWLKKLIADEGLHIALDLTNALTQKYTGGYIFEELAGLANATGIDYLMLRRIHLLGELTKGGCSMMGAWGAATANKGTIQLRAFDWDVHGPYKNVPLITVYHPNSGNGHAFANIGFAGWIGSFSGISSTQMAISEIGVSFPDDTFGKESRSGVPFTYLLRDILQFDKTLDDSINRIKTAHRTCNLILGVGDGKQGSFRAFQYSKTVANVIDDTNLLPANDTWHPKIQNVVYYGMDWLCPPFSQSLAQQINKFHGKIDAEITARYIVPMTTTGNLQVAIYDLTNQQLLFSYAAKDGASGDPMAYNRQYMQLDMNTMWTEQPPQ